MQPVSPTREGERQRGDAETEKEKEKEKEPSLRGGCAGSEIFMLRGVYPETPRVLRLHSLHSTLIR